jgi:hypothetical protein
MQNLPYENQVVMCREKNKKTYHRAVYKNGVFIAGGDYPIKVYEIKPVEWFDFDEFHKE